MNERTNGRYQEQTNHEIERLTTTSLSGTALSAARISVRPARHPASGSIDAPIGGPSVPLNKELRKALVALKATRNKPEPREHIIHSERDLGMSANAVTVWFHRLYASLGFTGASSHSGRRTFITRHCGLADGHPANLRSCVIQIHDDPPCHREPAARLFLIRK